MRTIWKYIVPGILKVPKGAIALSVQEQGTFKVVWFEVPDTDAPIEVRKFEGFFTGDTLPDRVIEYIGTVQEEELVWHIYEVTP